MINRKIIYEDLKSKLEKVGFIFQKDQKPYLQKRKELELVFEHPSLLREFQLNGFSINAKKFYLKPLSDEENSEIGLVTGKTSPLNKIKDFIKPNTIDSFDDNSAWTNSENEFTLDILLNQINLYINTPKNPIEKFYKSYLLTWNPSKWEWKDFKNKIENLEKRGSIEERWSCGNSKSIKKGDRIFLTRLGNEPRGIIGSGYAISSPYLESHWDGSPGKNSNYINFEFDILIDPDRDQFFDKEFLDKIDPNHIQQWFPQQSGISINNELIDSLETSWFEFFSKNIRIGQNLVLSDSNIDLNQAYVEGKSKEVLLTRYERNPLARKRSLEYHGYSCKICDFNFELNFGEIRRGFIHVHHVNPISTIGQEYSINPIVDLIPVCPNCHAMIHSKTPAYSIEEIKIIRQSNEDS
ncbi:HNH endonuclease [Leptospira levettii]|uniref:HNH endonuclease n=1 Tax=Leptospira levettii TaxID=2023178 RepID=UPI0010836BE5|nr:HNH endonuclease [Leptospira levettii]TGM33906.1 hypothetical protein EHQ71_00010 [Leptospira levettii]TGM85386.1 hypothetical protein EHR00_04825 [Leptospira levettii]